MRSEIYCTAPVARDRTGIAHHELAQAVQVNVPPISTWERSMGCRPVVVGCSRSSKGTAPEGCASPRSGLPPMIRLPLPAPCKEVQKRNTVRCEVLVGLSGLSDQHWCSPGSSCPQHQTQVVVSCPLTVGGRHGPLSFCKFAARSGWESQLRCPTSSAVFQLHW